MPSNSAFVMLAGCQGLCVICDAPAELVVFHKGNRLSSGSHHYFIVVHYRI